jgi:hypothetical protein
MYNLEVTHREVRLCVVQSAIFVLKIIVFKKQHVSVKLCSKLGKTDLETCVTVDRTQTFEQFSKFKKWDDFF